MNIILDECAIDLVPETWKSEKSVIAHQNKYKRLPLRNGSYHQHLLKNLDLSERNDRPDILHFGLLTILGYTRIIGDLGIFFNCPRGIYKVNPKTRLPRDQQRFYGLIEGVFQGNSNDFIYPSSIKLQEVDTLIFSTQGVNLNQLDIKQYHNFVFGGFAHGSLVDKYPNFTKVSLSEQSLELWTALSIFLNYIK